MTVKVEMIPQCVGSSELLAQQMQDIFASSGIRTLLHQDTSVEEYTWRVYSCESQSGYHVYLLEVCDEEDIDYQRVYITNAQLMKIFFIESQESLVLRFEDKSTGEWYPPVMHNLLHNEAVQDMICVYDDTNEKKETVKN